MAHSFDAKNNIPKEEGRGGEEGEERIEIRNLPLVGAYSERDCTDPSVLAAAEYAKNLYVSQYLQGKKSLKNKGGTGPSKHQNKEIFSFEVYQASVQVVAGLNFKLSMRLYDDNTCYGTLEDVVIYRDLTQSYTVTQWGIFNPCEEVIEKEEEILDSVESDGYYDAT